jgi:hypothetical protein
LHFSGNGLDPRTYGDKALAQLAAMFAKGFVEKLAGARPQGVDPILPQLETAWRNSSKAESYFLWWNYSVHLCIFDPLPSSIRRQAQSANLRALRSLQQWEYGLCYGKHGLLSAY